MEFEHAQQQWFCIPVWGRLPVAKGLTHMAHEPPCPHTPMDYMYNRVLTPLQAVVLEGKYWKRKVDAVATEYRKWRFYMERKNVCSLTLSLWE